MTFRVYLSVAALGLAACPQPTWASDDPVEFSATHDIKPGEAHAVSVGDDSDHLLMLVKTSGTNKSLGKVAFLDGATETEVSYGEIQKGSGPHHGYISYKADDGTMLNEFNGYATTVMVNGKPQIVAVGSWHTVGGSGRYAGGSGVGTYRTRLNPPAFEGSTDWDGTFVEGRK